MFLAASVTNWCTARPRWTYSWTMTFSSDVWTFNSLLPYSMKPGLRNLFMKKLIRERVVPTRDARVSCVRSIGRGLQSKEFRQRRAPCESRCCRKAS